MIEPGKCYTNIQKTKFIFITERFSNQYVYFDMLDFTQRTPYGSGYCFDEKFLMQAYPIKQSANYYIRRLEKYGNQLIERAKELRKK